MFMNGAQLSDDAAFRAQILWNVKRYCKTLAVTKTGQWISNQSSWGLKTWQHQVNLRQCWNYIDVVWPFLRPAMDDSDKELCSKCSNVSDFSYIIHNALHNGLPPFSDRGRNGHNDYVANPLAFPRMALNWFDWDHNPLISKSQCCFKAKNLYGCFPTVPHVQRWFFGKKDVKHTSLWKSFTFVRRCTAASLRPRNLKKQRSSWGLPWVKAENICTMPKCTQKQSASII